MNNVTLLCGGVGGAKMADGLAQILSPDQLTIVVNTGDDFQHLGLTICPDLDTVMYTLGGVANSQTGWGREDESWRVLETVGALGGPDWFRLGDQDIATHLIRSSRLAQGDRLTDIVADLSRGLGIEHTILPMSDRPVPTKIETEDGILDFQDYFVLQRWQPIMKSVQLPDMARATKEVIRAIATADVVVIAPSNPFVSIDPILNAYPVRATVADVPAVVVAMSPIIAGDAVKGPAAKMMRELGMDVSALAIADYYDDLIDGFIYDSQDVGAFDDESAGLLCTNTWMRNRDDRKRVASELLAFAKSLIP